MVLAPDAEPLRVEVGDDENGAPFVTLSRPLDTGFARYPTGTRIIPELFLESAQFPGLTMAVGSMLRPGADKPDAARLLFSTVPLEAGDHVAVTGGRHAPSAPVAPNRFARGTLIDTPHGQIAVEDLEHGDEVLMRDGSTQLVTWIGRERLSPLELVLMAQLRPVRIGAGALTGGRPGQDLLVSQEHRLVVDDWRAAYLFGEDEILAPAKSLINGRNVRLECPLAGVEYFHMLMSAESLVCANGLWAETLQADADSLACLPPALQREAGALATVYGAGGTTRPPLPALPHETTTTIAA